MVPGLGIFENPSSPAQFPVVFYYEGIRELTKEIIAFRDARDWEQFHNLKDLVMALSIESAERLESQFNSKL